MKTGRYSIKELLTHNEIEQIIIPEIQRDYVWKKKNVQSLLFSIIERFKKKSSDRIEINIEGQTIPEKSIAEYLQKEYDKLRNNLKIGFIYAYHDNEYAGKFFLIDGQQRFTTLYLLLLAIYVKNNNGEKFRELYFKNEILKIDYKVRESSHEFMRELVQSVLSNKKDINLKNSNRYYEHLYNEDVTVNSLISNFGVIGEVIDSDEQLKVDGNYDKFIEFIEDFIEVNYFDTNLSEQGEQLYLYMNSRGEFLSHHEIIKSEIVKKVGEGSGFIEKKKEVGDNWENWQNYFWRHRGQNESADKGFDEFLKWATIIDICTKDSPEIIQEKIKNKVQTIREAKENYIHRTKAKLDTQREYLAKYQIQNLGADYLTSIFNITKDIFSVKSEYFPVKQSWLHNIGGAINYIVLLPLIYFIKNSNWLDESQKTRDIERLAMFLKNISYFESISKNPDNAVIDAIELVKQLCDEKKTDLIYWVSNEKLNRKFKSILTESEREKLELFKESDDLRSKIEEIVWNITLDDKVSTFLKGDISLFVYSTNRNNTANEIDVEYIDSLQAYYDTFKEVLDHSELDKNTDNTDLFRKALLTFGDYCIDTSGSYRFGHRIDGYSFGYYYNRDNKEWETIIAEHKSVWADFLFSAKNRKEDTLNDFMLNCISSYHEGDWREPFIKDDSVLEYCKKKRFLYENSNRIFLIEEKDKGYIEIQNFLLEKSLSSLYAETFEHNICVLNIDFDSRKKQLKFARDQYAIDIIKNDDRWYSKLIYRDEYNINGQFSTFFANDWIQDEFMTDRIEKQNSLLYEYDNELSIIKNVENISDKIKMLYNEIEEIFKK